jgi:thymidylate synthase (FAD)
MNEIKVLDHGFVKLRNLAGPTRRKTTVIQATNPGTLQQEVHIIDREFDADDTDVANAARLSFEGQDQDRSYEMEMKLNRYLLANSHMTPFESIVVWLEFKMPIFVARQLVRQRTQSINEASARYITLPGEWYIPEVVGGKAANKKQGQADNLSPEVQAKFKRRLYDSCSKDYEEYLEAMADGVAPEHARMFLHVNHYTHWMTTMNLRNLFMSLLALRDHSHAQIESQLYARATIELIEPHLPGLMQLYRELVKK